MARKDTGTAHSSYTLLLLKTGGHYYRSNGRRRCGRRHMPRFQPALLDLWKKQSEVASVNFVVPSYSKLQDYWIIKHRQALVIVKSQDLQAHTLLWIDCMISQDGHPSFIKRERGITKIQYQPPSLKHQSPLKAAPWQVVGLGRSKFVITSIWRRYFFTNMLL